MDQAIAGPVNRDVLDKRRSLRNASGNLLDIHRTHDPRPVALPLPSRPEKTDKAWLLSEAVDLLNLAKHTANLAQVRSTLELIGKITGDLVDRKELRVVRSWADLTDAEVDALAAGETIDATISDETCEPEREG